MSVGEKEIIQSSLANQSLARFIRSNLTQSLASVGFSSLLVADLLKNLDHLDPKVFGDVHHHELETVYRIGFFQKIVPSYFMRYVLPVIPSAEKFLDVGCGTGILAKLCSESGKFKQVVGIDINSYPEWEEFTNKTAQFAVVQEAGFSEFLRETHPNVVALTWTLHHMEKDEQERYMQYIFNSLQPDAHVLILEDAYSDDLVPEKGKELAAEFMRWNTSDRQKIMSVYDWIANRVLARREKVPIPFAYRTMEEWTQFFGRVGFKVITQKYIGFPEQRDINTPQSLLVLAK